MSNEEPSLAVHSKAPDDNALRRLRAQSLMAWLEGEGERQRRRVVLPPKVGDPAVRGWVHVGVCVLVGTLAAGLFVCWLAGVAHAGSRGKHGLMEINRVVDELNGFDAEPVPPPGRPHE